MNNFAQKNIDSFVNFNNIKLRSGNSLFIMCVNVFLFSVGVFVVGQVLRDSQGGVIGILIALDVLFIIAEYFFACRLKKTAKMKWVLIQNSSVFAFLSCCFIVLAIILFNKIAFPYTYSVIGIIVCLLGFVLSNALRIVNVKRGYYRMKNPNGADTVNPGAAASGVLSVAFITIIAKPLERTLSLDGDSTVLMGIGLVCLVISFCINVMNGGFLKFYYTSRYGIEVNRTWYRVSTFLDRGKK